MNLPIPILCQSPTYVYASAQKYFPWPWGKLLVAQAHVNVPIREGVLKVRGLAKVVMNVIINMGTDIVVSILFAILFAAIPDFFNFAYQALTMPLNLLLILSARIYLLTLLILYTVKPSFSSLFLLAQIKIYVSTNSKSTPMSLNNPKTDSKQIASYAHVLNLESSPCDFQKCWFMKMGSKNIFKMENPKSRTTTKEPLS